MARQNKRLGRGLDALLGSKISEERNEQNSIESKDKVLWCSIDEISVRTDQPRRRFDEKALYELAQSIKEEGILQPLVVRKKDSGGYELIIGERRLRAAKLAGLERVPVVVKSLSDVRVFRAALAENLQREDLNPIELALAFKRIMEEEGLTQEELATVVGKDRSHIANVVRLLSLAPEVQLLVEEGKLTFGHARAIAALQEEALQIEAANEVIEKGLSVRQTEALVARLKNAKQKEKPSSTKKRSATVVRLEEMLQQRFGVRVRIDYNTKRGSGEIKLKFSNLDELDRLLALFGVSSEEL